MNEKDFKEQYLGQFVNNEDIDNYNICGECKFYDNGCTTSEIERKYGNYGTKACSEFIKQSKSI